MKNHPFAPLLSKLLVRAAWVILVSLLGCAEAMYLEVEESPPSPPPEMTQVTPDTPNEPPPSDRCQGLTVTQPINGAVLSTEHVKMEGTLTTPDSVDMSISGQSVHAVAGRFELSLRLPDGHHEVDVRCDDTTITRQFTIRSGRPRFVVDSPKSGGVYESINGEVEVKGRLENAYDITRIQINQVPIFLDANGGFSLMYQPKKGLNHLDFEVTTPRGDTVDLRRSFLYGQFTDWSAVDRNSVSVEIGESALTKIARAVEHQLTDDDLEELLDDHMGRRGDLELHEIKYDRIEIELAPHQGRLRVKLRLHDFGLKFTYHYRILGIGGRIRGWAKCDPAEVEADVVLSSSAGGNFSLRVDNPEVNLRRFDLDLNDFYSIVEGLIQPMVRDIGRDAMVKAMRDVVLKDLIQAELLNQEIDLFGHTTRLKVEIDQLAVSPMGIHGSAAATLDPFQIAYDAPGFWTSTSPEQPSPNRDDMSLSMSVNLLNRMLGEAWRGGLLDIDLYRILGDDDALSAALLFGPAGPKMAEHIPATSTVQLNAQALMQPIVVIDTPETGQVSIHVGALQVKMASQNHQGELVDWAVAEISLKLEVTPVYVDGQFQVRAHLESRLEIIDAPLFDLDETGLETFLEALLTGFTGPALDDAVNGMFRFGDIDILGLSVAGVNFSGIPNRRGHLYLGLDLAHR